jgi:hypothetical protein
MGSVHAKHFKRGRRAPSVSSARKPVAPVLPLTDPGSPKPDSFHQPSRQTFQSAVADVLSRLEVVHAVVICAAHALRHQNTEIDGEVADALRHCASDVLDAQIERLTAIVGEVKP